MKPGEGLVLTAAAASCSLGEDRSEILAAMIDGRTAIEDAPAIEGEFQPESPGGPVAKIRAAQVSESAPEVGPVPDRAEKLLNRSIRQAMAEAGLDRATIERMKSDGRRIETVFGTTLGGMRHLGRGLRNGRLEALSRTTTATVTRAALGRHRTSTWRIGRSRRRALPESARWRSPRRRCWLAKPICCSRCRTIRSANSHSPVSLVSDWSAKVRFVPSPRIERECGWAKATACSSWNGRKMPRHAERGRSHEFWAGEARVMRII